MDVIVGRAALLIIDMQHDFLDDDAPIKCPEGRQIIPTIQQLLTAAREAGVPVIFTQEMHRPNGIDFGREMDEPQPAHCVAGTHGVNIVPELMPQPNDTILPKPRYSAFVGTDFPYVLNGVGVGAGDTLIITGVNTDVCVHYTAIDAFQRDYRVRVVTDCVAGTNAEGHNAALRAIKMLQVDGLVTHDQVLTAFASYTPQRLAARSVSER